MASTQLYHDATTGNQKTWTFSAWIKRSKLGGNSYLFNQGSSSSNFVGIYFGTPDDLRVYNEVSSNQTLYFRTNRLFRDTSAWYHIVVKCDTTQSTEADRFKIYINGVQETSFYTSAYPAQNSDTNMGEANRQRIGVYHPAGNSPNSYWDGSMSHIHFTDGYAYDASAFGSTDSTTGEWKINTSPSVTYGTNGFFILKDGNSGTDQSGQSNTFSISGSLTKTEDNPSNVFATWNPLNNYFAASTFSQGNNTIATNAGNYTWNTSTLGFQTGKWYWENKIVSTSTTDMFGITGRVNSNDVHNELGEFADTYGFNAESGNMHNNNTNTAYASAFQTNGNIVQIAVDMTNLKIHLGVNGVWQNSSNPSNNTGGFTIGAISTTTDGFYFPAIGDWSSSAGTFSTNFGNGYQGTTAVSSAGSNASGIGIFEYDVPTGYTALSTKGLNL